MAKSKMNENLKGRQKQDEELTNKILLVFGGSLLALTLLMLINRLLMNVSLYVSVVYICGYVAIALLVCAVAGLICAGYMLTKKTENTWGRRIFGISIISLLLSAMLGAIRYVQEQAFSYLYIFLIAIALLYLIFQIYQKDFFLQALTVGGTALLLYVFSRGLDNLTVSGILYAAYGAGTALLLLTTGVAYYLSKHNGTLGKLKILTPSANYTLMYITFGICLVTLLVCLLVGATVSFWAMIGILVYLFVLAVYYTMRLM